MRFRPLAVVASLLLAVVLGGFAGGCGEEDDDAPEVSPELTRIESLAEDSIDFALSGNLAEASRLANDLKQAWDTYRPEAEQKGASQELLASEDSYINALVAGSREVGRQPLDVARLANAATEPLGGLFALYKGRIPSAVFELDYLEHELLIDGEGGSSALARSHVAELQETWKELRSQVLKVPGGSALVAVYDANIEHHEDAARSGNTVLVSRHAFVGLELVDVIERLFDESDPPD